MTATSAPCTLAAALRSARRRLAAVSDTPDLDARWLAEHALDVGAAYLLAHADTPLPATASARYESLVERRAAGEPLAYIIGRAGFWSLDLRVTPDVLIPRPDTETLVEAALARLPPDAPLAVADLGTGSGAIALALGGACSLVGGFDPVGLGLGLTACVLGALALGFRTEVLGAWIGGMIVVLLLAVAAQVLAPGATVMLTLTLSTLDMPLEGAGLLLAIDPILDMGRTAINVAGQILVPMIVAKREGILEEPAPEGLLPAEA